MSLSYCYVIKTERAKPVYPSNKIRTGKTVKHSVGYAGKRFRRKRRLDRNGQDRVSEFDSTQKACPERSRRGADFREVLKCERVWRTFY